MMMSFLLECATQNILIGGACAIPLFGLFAIGIAVFSKYDSYLDKSLIQERTVLIEYLENVQKELEKKKDREADHKLSVVKEECRCPIDRKDQWCQMCRLYRQQKQ